MLLDLPEYYNTSSAEIVGEKLYILSNRFSFERIMYDLTYQNSFEINDELFCYLCNKELSRKKATVDHVYPRAIGGISITNNLKIACRKCNSRKAAYTLQEYLEIPRSCTKEFKRNHDSKCKGMNTRFFKSYGFRLPVYWTNRLLLADIKFDKSFPFTKGERYEKDLYFYCKYNKFPRPLVVDERLVVLDNTIIYMIAKEAGLTRIPAVFCENVRKENLNFLW